MTDHAEGLEEQGAAEATLTVRLPASAARRLEELAAQRGLDTEALVRDLLEQEAQTASSDAGSPRFERDLARAIHRTPMDVEASRNRVLAGARPGRRPTPGKTWLDMVTGRWPGEETDDEIQTALERMS